MEQRSRDQYTLAWGYAVELIAVAFLWILIELRVGFIETAKFLYLKKADIFVFVAIAAGVCGVFFAAFIAAMCVEFGKELRKAGAANEYFVALTIPFLALGAAFAALYLVESAAPAFSAELALFFLIYATINCITMVRNVYGLYKLWQDLEQLNT